MCTVSEPLAQQLREFHGKKTFVVLNGYEPDEFAGPARLFDRFTILYTGMIYPRRREPGLLFAAVRALADRGVLRPCDLRLVFYGPNHDLTLAMARQAGVEAFVECHGHVKREQALDLQRQAQLLLQLEWNDKRALGIFPGKFFEYLGSGRPVMAVGPKGGVIDETLRRTGCGRVLSELSELESYLEQVVTAYRAGAAPTANPDSVVLADYTRRRQAQVLAQHLDQLSR